jgi:hypothetical protein
MQPALIITTDNQLDELLARLPPGYEPLERVRYFLRDKQLVLVGPGFFHTARAPSDFQPAEGRDFSGR